jgi:glycosyltransferase involved in cell wall biosynthesis
MKAMVKPSGASQLRQTFPACDLTVAICTYRRPEMITGVLDTLERQSVRAGRRWEVLVVDNDDQQSAAAPVVATIARGHLECRYVNESAVGLSRARNRAIDEAQGAVIAFLDDDVFVDAGWLEALLGTFEMHDADCVGGRVLVEWEGTPSPAVMRHERTLACFDAGPADRRLVRRETPIGANLAIRKDVLLSSGRFLPYLGRSGSNSMGCEEIELILRLMAQGCNVWYSARALVHHRTSGERLSEQYYYKREYWSGVSLAAVDRLQRSRLYCYAKGFVRFVQAMLVLAPMSVISSAVGDRGAAFMSKCDRKKYVGYWAETIGVAGRPS